MRHCGYRRRFTQDLYLALQRVMQNRKTSLPVAPIWAIYVIIFGNISRYSLVSWQIYYLLLKQSWLMSKLVFRDWTKQSSFYCLIIPIHVFFLHKSGPWWFVKRVHEYAKTNWMRFYSNLTCRQPHWSCDEHIWNQQPITLSALQASKPPFCFNPFCSCIWSCLAMTDPNSPGPTNMYHPLETLCHKVKNQYQKFSSSVVLPHSKVTSSYIVDCTLLKMKPRHHQYLQ